MCGHENEAKTGASSAYMPLFINMKGKRVLVVGGGSVATHKVAVLLRHGVKPLVVAPDISERIEAWENEGKLTCVRRAFERQDAAGCFMVYAAANSKPVNDAVINAARAHGALCCAVDRPDGEVLTPSELEYDGMRIALSSSGTSPARTKRMRKALQAWLAQYVDDEAPADEAHASHNKDSEKR